MAKPLLRSVLLVCEVRRYDRHVNVHACAWVGVDVVLCVCVCVYHHRQMVGSTRVQDTLSYLAYRRGIQTWREMKNTGTERGGGEVGSTCMVIKRTI